MEPEDAFGDYDPELVKIESAERLPVDVAVGMQLETYANLGDEPGSGIVYTVTDIAEGKVVLDGNHPWAGKRLRFDCRILDVRAATPEEVEHGHVHGARRHHHRRCSRCAPAASRPAGSCNRPSLRHVFRTRAACEVRKVPRAHRAAS